MELSTTWGINPLADRRGRLYFVECDQIANETINAVRGGNTGPTVYQTGEMGADAP